MRRLATALLAALMIFATPTVTGITSSEMGAPIQVESDAQAHDRRACHTGTYFEWGFFPIKHIATSYTWSYAHQRRYTFRQHRHGSTWPTHTQWTYCGWKKVTLTFDGGVPVCYFEDGNESFDPEPGDLGPEPDPADLTDPWCEGDPES